LTSAIEIPPADTFLDKQAQLFQKVLLISFSLESFNKFILGMAWFRQITGHNLKTSVMKRKLPKLYIMKRIMIPVFAVAVAMTACNTTPDTTTQKAIQPAVDTTGLAEFQAWKAQNELVSTQQNAAMQPQTREIVRYYPVSSARRSSGSRTSTSSGTASTTRKKGWSSAAKGAVIGGVAGAAGGAIINKKNRALGGVVGGVIGAGVGYGIGRSIDKKNGRY
jgi:hypothetical protein